ncbi:hypothetical protein NTE_03435 [Candidatus Nitrososphaera evergladensis SR1]|uniref:Uncharacterized protein n=1 Tax=Candidatus Nitrososphaera evergladensis SR1 TaxID=1459636 RepID=A0A075MWF5_9ARCH|nr:hypothetical protein [Candidatus Nitrososphaera evergladensis]AIF85463.1 hypothetical protein NTE_03435 [Candidatus Nitrososphaera evergladensis SR1]
MPTVGAKVSQKEFDAITEYANLCGETVSNLIRKIVVADATILHGGWVDEHPEYECSIPMPQNVSGEEENRILEEKTNKIRRILGWRDIKL